MSPHNAKKPTQAQATRARRRLPRRRHRVRGSFQTATTALVLLAAAVAAPSPPRDLLYGVVVTSAESSSPPAAPTRTTGAEEEESAPSFWGGSARRSAMASSPRDDGEATDDVCRATEERSCRFPASEKDDAAPSRTGWDDDASGDALRETGDPTTDNRRWNWIPEADHPCTVRRLSLSELRGEFGPAGLPPLYPEPLVIYDDRRGGGGGSSGRRNARFAELTSLGRMQSYLPPGFEVTLSSSNSVSSHRRTIPLSRYLDETLHPGVTLPDQLSNETWYLFGETYTEEWVALLTNYTLPPCRTCDRELSALAFGIGNRGSGVQWHTHGLGFSEAVHGRKHWVLYAPRRRPTYDVDWNSRHWMEYFYPTLSAADRPHECTLEEGDMIYFPDGYHHATINLDPYTAFVSTFTTEHF